MFCEVAKYLPNLVQTRAGSCGRYCGVRSVFYLVSLGIPSERALLGTSEIQGDELKGTREREKEGLQTLNRFPLALPECWQSQSDCSSHVILY